MARPAPVIYLLHGDDEFAIAQSVSKLEARLGDPASAALNLTRLDGRLFDPAGLLSVAAAMPFLAERRIVVLTHPLAQLNGEAAQKNFIELLQKVPPSTALVLVEYSLLTGEKQRRKGKLNWLEAWAKSNPERVYLKAYPLPRGIEMAHWIGRHARGLDGQITPQAAELLAGLTGGDPRLADQEIQKLLAHVNYQRPIDVADVELLTANAGQADIFSMVDALGNRDRRRALGSLHRLLEGQDPSGIFGMVVRQFRLLLLTREILDSGGGRNEVITQIKVVPFVAEKMIGQARHFTLPGLESIYHRLLEADVAVKTGEMPADLSLDTLVAELT
jgi:DNA polymerase-3 subunit delta